jgi:hypothetical protein
MKEIVCSGQVELTILTAAKYLACLIDKCCVRAIEPKDLTFYKTKKSRQNQTSPCNHMRVSCIW